MTRRHTLALAGTLLGLMSTNGLQFPAARAQDAQGAPSVTFQTEVTYVDVDVAVTDEAGKFVSDLKRDDFQVFEDGKPQKVETFTLVDIPVVKQQMFTGVNRPIVPDTQTNRQPFAGRVYVIVLDDFNTSPIRTFHTRKAAKQFVEQYFGDNDIAAVLYTSGRTDAAQEFTTDRQRLMAAIDKFVGRGMRSLTLDRIDQYYQQQIIASNNSGGDSSTDGGNVAAEPTDTYSRTDPTDFERGFRAISTLDTLKNTSEFLASVRGRRKAVLFFSEGIDYPITDLFGMHSASDVIRATQDAISAAARSNVNYFTIDPRGLVGLTSDYLEMASAGTMVNPAATNTNAPMSSVLGGTTGGALYAANELMNELLLSQGNLRTLAEETGGISAVNRNSLVSTFEAIVSANSHYYVIGYYPPTHPRDGRFHKIEVKLNRPGLKVQARKGYASPSGRTPEERKRDEAARIAREARKPAGDKTSTELRAMLVNSPIQQSGLTMTVQAAPFRGSSKDSSVAFAIEMDGAKMPFAPPNEKGLFTNAVELSFFGVNDQGKASGGTRIALDLTLRPETQERVKRFGLRFNPRINLPPGRYQVRVGARETLGGLSGSVFLDLDVPDFSKEKLAMGGLLVTAPTTQLWATPQPDPVVAKLLPTPATSRRVFPQSDVLALYTELYDNITKSKPHQVDVVVQIISESGTEVFNHRDSLNNGTAGSKPWEIYGYPSEIPLKGIAPGNYLLRVEAQVRGNIDDAKPVARETVLTVVP